MSDGPYASYLPQERVDNAHARLAEEQKALADWTQKWADCDRTNPDDTYVISHRLAGAREAVLATEQYIHDGCRRVPATA